MNQDNHFSDEFLNAFVDDQLTPEEKSLAYARLHQDPALSQRICELRKIRDLVRLSYANPPAAQPNATRIGKHSKWRLNVAAGLLLAVGLVLGWTLHGPESPGPATTVAALQNGSVPAQREMKVLLHFRSNDPARMKEVLDEAENLIQHYKSLGQPARVEIVTNGEGLDLLRVDTSPYAKRIELMHRQYDNLAFLACQNTIDNLRLDRGIVARLLPQVMITDSGVAQIMRRQQEGWIYLRV